MLENLSIPNYEGASLRENVLGADNQQERPTEKSGAQAQGFVEGHDFSRAVKRQN